MGNGPVYERLIVNIDISADPKVSDSIDLLGKQFKGLDLPSSWTTSDVTFLGSFDDSTFKAICDEDNNVITMAGLAQNQIALMLRASPVISAVRYLKIKSSTDQGADRAVGILVGCES